MTIELQKGGWYLIEWSEFKSGPFLTFLEAYTIYSNIKLNRKVVP